MCIRDSFYKMNDKLEQILVQQEKIRETSKNHALANAGGPHVDELVRKMAIWLIPLVAVMVVMAYYTFRIRQEIVKTKLL